MGRRDSGPQGPENKKQLRECLTRLLKKKKVQDITVRELTDMADLNRGTFTCTTGTCSICLKTENELLDEFNSLMYRHNAQDLTNNLAAVFVDIFHLVKDNSDLVYILLGENGDLSFVNRLKHLVREKCLQDWMEVFRSGNSAFSKPTIPSLCPAA